MNTKNPVEKSTPAPVPQYERPRIAAQEIRISLSTLWHWAKTRPDFPKPIKAGERVTLFDVTAIRAWLASKAEVAQ